MPVRVLVIDDEPNIRELFEDALRRNGHQVVTCASGEEAVERAREIGFTHAFVDIKMPGLNGVETLKLLREINPGACFVMITGYAGSEMVDESLGNGAMLCLAKPFGVAQILDLVEDGS